MTIRTCDKCLKTITSNREEFRVGQMFGPLHALLCADCFQPYLAKMLKEGVSVAGVDDKVKH